MTLLLIAVGAAIGALARYLTDVAVQARHDSVFPWGTFVVNVVGCLLLGMVGALAGRIEAAYAAGLGTGLCGALSTYSTFSYETLRLVEGGAGGYAVANVLGSTVVGVAAATLGWVLVP